MKTRAALLSTGLMLLALHAGARAAALSAVDVARVDAVVGQALMDKQAPGAVVVIVKDGTVVLRKAYGMADLQAKRPMTARTQFEIGSLTKQMAAVAVLRLAASGKLSLDDKVGKYLPDYPAAAAVTIDQLLRQVSGLPDFAGTPAFAANATSRPTDFPTRN